MTPLLTGVPSSRPSSSAAFFETPLPTGNPSMSTIPPCAPSCLKLFSTNSPRPIFWKNSGCQLFSVGTNEHSHVTEQHERWLSLVALRSRGWTRRLGVRATCGWVGPCHATRHAGEARRCLGERAMGGSSSSRRDPALVIGEVTR